MELLWSCECLHKSAKPTAGLVGAILCGIERWLNAAAGQLAQIELVTRLVLYRVICL